MEKNLKWVFTKKEDLIWLIFPSLIGFLIVISYFVMTELFSLKKYTAIIIIYFSWGLLFDGTHTFATYSRTYFDKEFFRENKSLLLRSLLIFLVGPAFIFIIYSLHNSLNEASMSFIIFNRFAICYAYYHLIRQHWGFVVIYRNKNKESNKLTRKLDSYILGLGTIFPFLHGQMGEFKIIHSSELILFSSEEWNNLAIYLLSLGVIILAFYVTKISFFKKMKLDIISIILITGSFVIFIINTYGLNSVLAFSSYLVAVFFGITFIYYLIILLKVKERFNYPKWILILTVIISYNIIFHLNVPILITIAAITVFHNIQYHKIINFHNVNKYQKSNKKKHGFAVVLTKRISVFILLALLFNLVFIPRYIINVMNYNLILNYLVATFFWGIPFHHYYLDSVIWKIKGNKPLNKNLKIE